MKCENRFCLYEKDGFCRLAKIELDIQGKCKECIYLPYDDQLDLVKEKIVAAYQ